MLRRKVLSLGTVLAFLLSSGIAVGQDTQQPPAAPAAEPAATVVGEAPAAAPAAREEEKTEEIVVTGSRIRRKDLTTPAPVSIVNRDALQNSGKVSLGDFLQSLPEQGNALNTQVNNGNDGSVRVNLRSLGSARTLVLVNGRRMVYGGTGADSSTDLNSIPAAAIERVEILKDGASAVYGSDAIAGVVNVILKKKYSGSEASAYGGVTGESDGRTYDISAMTGTGSEKGNMLFSVGYQEQRAVYSGDRQWSATTFDYDFSTGEKIPTGNSGTFPDGRFSLPGITRDPVTREITACNTAAGSDTYDALCAVALGGTNANFVPDFDGASTTYSLYDGSLFNTNPTNYLITPNRRMQIFATGDHNLGEIARAFFEASYVNRTSAQDLAAMPVTNTVIPTKPIFISPDSLYNPLGIEIRTWRKRTTEFGSRHWSQDLDTFHVVAGLDGSLGDWAGPLRGWTWEASYNYGRTAGTSINEGQVRVPNLANAVGPSMVFNGQEICVRVPGDPTTVIPGCVPANMLGGEGALSVAARDYLTFTGTDKGYNQQQIYAFNTTGELFNLPTSERPIGFAVGVEHRLEAAGYQPDVITASLESAGNNQLPTAGGYDVTEGYAELSIPLLTGMKGAEDVELTAAIRAFDYTTFGSDMTYKFGARWAPIRDVTIRGTFSTAFRAPNVGELYGGTADSYDFTNGDPCYEGNYDPDGIGGIPPPPQCTAAQPWGGVSGATGSQDTATQFLSKRSPNPNLKPETADIFTVGVVIAPRALPNLTATVDYFNIKLDKTIDIREAQYILDQCYAQDDLAMCALITRNQDTSSIEQIIDLRENLGGTDTSGIDFAVRYGIPTPGFGRFNLALDGSYLLVYDEIDVSGNVTDHVGNYDGGLAMPKFKANASVLWAKGGLGAGLTARYIPSYDECASGFCSSGDPDKRSVDSYLPVDLFVAYALKTSAGTTSLSVGVQNVFDTDPPYLYNAGSANADPSTYDYLGRYYYARLVQAF